MALTRRNEFLPSVFSDFFEDDFLSPRFQAPGNNLPAVNVKELDNEYEIEMAAPGVPKENIRIEVDNDMLTISGEEKTEHKEEGNGGRYTRREFGYTSFSRSFRLPNIVDTDNIKAETKEGIVHLHIPKREEARRKPRKEIKLS